MGKKKDKLRQLKEQLSVKSDVKITYRAVDVGNYEEVDAAVSSSIKEIGEIDILINNVSNPAIHNVKEYKYRQHN